METIADEFSVADKTLHIPALAEIDPNPPVQSRFRLPTLPRYLTPRRRRITWKSKKEREMRRRKKRERERSLNGEKEVAILQRVALIFGGAPGARAMSRALCMIRRCLMFVRIIPRSVFHQLPEPCDFEFGRVADHENAN